MLKELNNSDEFYEMIASTENVFIDFYADYCSPCIRLIPFIESLTEKYPTFAFYKINIENMNCQQVVEQFEVDKIPRFVIFKNSVVVSDFTGANTTNIVNQLNKNV